MTRPVPHMYQERLEEAALQVLQQRRGREAHRAAPGAGVYASKIMRPLLRDIGLTLPEIQRRWADIVGEKLGELTEPERLSGPGAHQTLTLRTHPAASPLVQHQIPLILDRLRLAGAGVAKIAVVQGSLTAKRPAPLPARPVQASIDEDAILAALTEIDHGPLRAALERLGRAVHGKVR